MSDEGSVFLLTLTVSLFAARLVWECWQCHLLWSVSPPRRRLRPNPRAPFVPRTRPTFSAHRKVKL